MKDKKAGKTTTGAVKPRKKSRFLLIFVCIFLAVVLVFTAVLGIIALVKRNNAVVRYGSYMIDEGEASYFASYYKYRYLVGLSDSGISGYDTPSFWESRSESGESYGSLLEKSFKEYLCGILVANALFERYSELESADKENIKLMKERALESYGSEEKFNEEAAKYGFDYDDYQGAIELLYKATKAQTAIFGAKGEKLSSYPSECKAYYEDNYSRVSLLFLRDKEIIEKDENGHTSLRPITEEEKALRQEYADTLRAAIHNRVNNLDGERITPEMFEHFYKKSDSDLNRYRGYYLAKNAESTVELATEFPEIVDKAMSMKVGEYAELECSVGVCFIYKEALDENAFTDKDDPFFSDFYSDALYSIYSDMLSVYAPQVIFSDKFSEIDVVSVPKNYQFVIGVIQ